MLCMLEMATTMMATHSELSSHEALVQAGEAVVEVEWEEALMEAVGVVETVEEEEAAAAEVEEEEEEEVVVEEVHHPGDLTTDV